MEHQLLEDQLKGLETKGKSLRVNEGLFLEALGIDKQIEKAGGDMTDLEVTLNDSKYALAKLKKQKANAVAKTVDALAEKLNDALPEGKAVFTIDESGVFLGWEVDGKVKPLHGLSGGERVIFEGGLCHAPEAELIIYEAAEVHGVQRLPSLLSRTSKLEQQIIVNTWFAPENMEAVLKNGWSVTRL